MKKKNFLVTLFVMLFAAGSLLTAAEKIEYQDFELDRLLHEIEKPGEPIITNDYIIFTADVHHRFVGIAFDFEDFTEIHPFRALTKTLEDGTVIRKHLFYCYKRNHKKETIKYRLVIDGLWVADPLNPNKEYDPNAKLYFSKITDPHGVEVYTDVQKNSNVHFIYKGESGLDLHLAGTFTAWDPWIYSLTETKPGFYELDLPLPSGKYYYRYYIGLTPVLDNTNPKKVYAPDGRAASVIEVN